MRFITLTSAHPEDTQGDKIRVNVDAIGILWPGKYVGVWIHGQMIQVRESEAVIKRMLYDELEDWF